MDKSKTLFSLSGAITSKVTTCHPPFGDCTKHAVRTARMEIATAVQGATRILRIMICLHSAKDFPSVLRLYGIENSNARQSPNEM